MNIVLKITFKEIKNKDKWLLRCSFLIFLK